MVARALPWASVSVLGALVACSSAERSEPLATSQQAVGWASQTRLLPTVSDPMFGGSVKVSGNTAAVVSCKYPQSPQPQCSLYVFVRSGSQWTQQARLVPKATPWFTFHDVSGDTAVVTVQDPWAEGRAIVFERSGTTWTETATLEPADPGEYDFFGDSVAISGDTVLVGSRFSGARDYGAAYVFVRANGTWAQQARLQPLDVETDQQFGFSVALHGDTAVVGAFGDDEPGKIASGAAYVFVRNGNSWSQQAKLRASDATESLQFGSSVMLYENTALVTTWGTKSYFFVRSSNTWTEQQSLPLAPQTLWKDRVLSRDGANALSLYARSGATWSKVHTFQAAAEDVDHQESYFGWGSAFVDESTVLAPSPIEHNARRAVLVYGYGADPGDACTSDEQCASGHCAEGVCCDETCASPCQSCLAARKASGASGTCGAVKPNTDPKDQCLAAADVCGTTGSCDGLGACAVGPPGLACSAACDTGTSSKLGTCDGLGSCLFSAAVPCSKGYACVAGVCAQSCTSNAACDTANAYVCSEQKCLLGLGAQCSTSSECADGHCVDGVCCNTACNDACMACAPSATGAPGGQCAPAVAGTDPNDDCTADAAYPTSCGADGQCDGSGACRTHAAPGTACGGEPTSCENGTVAGLVCSELGVCGDDNVSCDPYACDGPVCATSCTTDDECVSDARCAVGGICAKREEQGSPCASPNDCTTGFCADGVCCDASCDSACVACNEPGKAGLCSNIDGLARPGHPDCADYTCRNGECPDECATDQDCRADHSCLGKQCVMAGGANPNDNTAGSPGVDAGPNDGLAGAPSAEPQPGQTPSTPAAGASSSGCGCRAAGGRDSAGALSLLVLAACLARRRRGESRAFSRSIN